MQNKAYQTLIRLLSSRDYSEHKLREKLKERGYPADEIDEAIQEVKNKKYLREDLYAEARAKAFINKGYSQNYVRQKLGQEHVSVTKEFIDDIYQEHKYSEVDQVRELVQKKLRGKKIEDYNHEVKIIRFILSKGHEMGAIKKVLKEYKNSQIEELDFES